MRRKLLTPTFHFKILNDFVEVFNKQANILVSKFNKTADGNTVTDIAKDVTLCALDIICGKILVYHYYMLHGCMVLSIFYMYKCIC